MGSELKKTFWWVGFSTLVLCLLPLFTHYGSLMDIISHFLIMGLFAVSLNLLVGYTGMVSFGHSAFFAIGAYTLGILSQRTEWPFPLILGMVVLVSGFAGAVIGFFCVRLGALYFAFLTLAFSQVIYGIIVRWVSLTGGDQGLIGGIQRPCINLGLGRWDLNVPENLYIAIVLLVMGSLLLCRMLVCSPFGAILVSIRENPHRVEFIGINVKLYQLIVFVIAAVFAGIAGALMALYVSGAYPDFAYWTKSAEPIFMVLVGGMKNFVGPLIGAASLIILTAILTTYTKLWALFVGLTLAIFIIGVKKGLLELIISGAEVITARYTIRLAPFFKGRRQKGD